MAAFGESNPAAEWCFLLTQAILDAYLHHDPSDGITATAEMFRIKPTDPIPSRQSYAQPRSPVSTTPTSSDGASATALREWSEGCLTKIRN
jgi:hypothetical protein